jgi:MFS family permease
MFVSLVLLGLTFEFPLASAGSVLSLLCILAYIAAFAIGLGPVFWVLIGELFPAEARAAGAGISAALNWLANFVVGLVFLPLASAIGQAATFWIFGAVCAVAFLFTVRYVPETRELAPAESGRELRAAT